MVGGGIQAAACAWDAAQRGLKVALVEARDFASGVSWNSLKTIHGGLRYLQTLDLARMRSSIRERSTLLRVAPELVRALVQAGAAIREVCELKQSLESVYLDLVSKEGTS